MIPGGPVTGPPRCARRWSVALAALSLACAAGSARAQDADCTLTAPTPVAVTIDAIPATVTSTTADYFVLYVSAQAVAGTSREVPILVAPGGASSTTLTPKVLGEPLANYRVEKYQVASPADVDGDCIDDLTDSNPVNPANGIEARHGANVIENQAAFTRLRSGYGFVKFLFSEPGAARPGTWFILGNNGHFGMANYYGIDWETMFTGELGYDSGLRRRDGGRGSWWWRYEHGVFRDRNAAEWVPLGQQLLAASMPFLADNLAFEIERESDRDKMTDAHFAAWHAAGVPIVPPTDWVDRPGVELSAASLSVGEGASGSYTVKLTGSTMFQVTVTASIDATTAAKVSGPDGAAGSSATLVFHAYSWNEGQTVTVHAQDDADMVDATATISHTVSGISTYANVTASSLAVSVVDDDRPKPVVKIGGGGG